MDFFASERKSTEVSHMLKIDENSGCKGVRKVKKYKWVMIYINTFIENNYIMKYLVVNAINFAQFIRRKGGKRKR